mmetsp:Transcript_39703/g.87159  ORF Transcript_39703/g.87159 Transcript_39703/m.87159 type:complete len:255 (+) Transcript_39703:105-869(+)
MLAQLLNGRGALLPALATARQAARVGGGDAAADARAAAADGSPLHALRQRDRVVRGAAKDAARVVLERSSLRHPHHGARARHLRRGLARAHAVRELPHAVRVRVVLRLQDVLLHLGRWIPLVLAARAGAHPADPLLRAVRRLHLGGSRLENDVFRREALHGLDDGRGVGAFLRVRRHLPDNGHQFWNARDRESAACARRLGKPPSLAAPLARRSQARVVAAAARGAPRRQARRASVGDRRAGATGPLGGQPRAV